MMPTDIQKIIDAGEFDEAINALEKLKKNISSTDYNFLLAVCFFGKKDYLESIKKFQLSLSADADNLVTRVNLALAYREARRDEDAKRTLKEYNFKYKESDNLYLKFCNLSIALGMIDLAQISLSKISEKSSEDFAKTSATINIHLKKYEYALSYFEKTFKNSFFHFNNYLVCLIHTGSNEKVVEVCSESPEFLDDENIYLNYGLAHQYVGNYENAIFVYQSLITKKYDRPQCYANLSRVYSLVSDFERAKQVSIEGLKKYPRYAPLITCYADSLSGLGDNELAEKKYKDSLNLDPSDSLTKWHYTLWMIREGNSCNGWANYKVGFLRPRNGRGEYLLDENLEWQGEKVSELFVWGEQGVGDQIMFGLYLTQLQKLVPSIKLYVEPRLRSVFSNYLSKLDGIDIVNDSETNMKHIPMGNLPAIFCNDQKLQKIKSPFLNLSDSGNEKRVGISWRGGSNQRLQSRRSAPVGLFRRLKSLNGKKLINLQYDALNDEVDFLRNIFGIENVETPDFDPKSDLNQWMKQIASCSKIITVDNSVVHFAGATNKRTLLLLPEHRDFRWRLGRDQTAYPWYSSVKVIENFKQYSLDDLAVKIDEEMCNA